MNSDPKNIAIALRLLADKLEVISPEKWPTIQKRITMIEEIVDGAKTTTMLPLEDISEALQTAIESNTSPTFVDDLGDAESIIIDGTINLVVLQEELNKKLTS